MTTNEKRLLHENAAILLLEVEEQEQYIEVCKKHDKDAYFNQRKEAAESIKADKLKRYNELMKQL
jgi:hypothetical protein